MSAKVCTKSAYSILCKLGYENKKVLQLHTSMLVCIMSAIILHKSAFSMHQVCIFTNRRLFPDKPPVGLQTWCRTRADFADFVQNLCILFLKKSAVSALCRLCHSLHSLHADCMQTFFSGVQSLHKGSCSSGPSKNLAIHYDADAHSAYRFGPGRAPALPPPPPPCWP